MRKLTAILVVGVICHNSAMAITGLSLGMHAGRLVNYRYDALSDELKRTATANSWISYGGVNENLTVVGAHLNWEIFSIIDFFGEANYAWNKTEVLHGVSLRISDFSFAVGAKKKLGLPVVKPYAGLGLLWHRFAFSFESDDEGLVLFLPDDQTRAGYALLAGAEIDLPALPVGPFVEARYNQVGTEDKKTTFAQFTVGVNVSF